MKIRLLLTAFLLFMLSFGIYYVAQFLASDGYDIASRQFIPAFAASFATVLMWMIWNLDLKFSIHRKESQNTLDAKTEDNIEKKKRDRLDAVLRDLSNEDLLSLKQRLMNGTIDDSHLEAALLGEDGELLRESR